MCLFVLYVCRYTVFYYLKGMGTWQPERQQWRAQKFSIAAFHFIYHIILNAVCTDMVIHGSWKCVEKNVLIACVGDYITRVEPRSEIVFDDCLF